MSYFSELRRAMDWLGEKEDLLVVGQAVEYSGTGIYKTLEGIPAEKKLELPVFEKTQLGLSIGVSLNGFTVLSVFPRWNFLLEATGMLVNTLDKLDQLSDGGYNPRVIIRTAVGSQTPLHPQAQHVGNFTDAFEKMLTRVNIVELKHSHYIVDVYKIAYESQRPTIIVEFPDRYDHE